MRLSTYFLPTLKENPADATMASHKLMMRAGLIRPLGAGIYSWLPIGWRVMKKVMEIIREEMDAVGAQEFHLPALNPIEIWQQTGRVESFGDTLFHIKNRPLVLAPTHEEIFTTIARDNIKSYRDLPQIWYQIQTKFRNEPRPRSGVIRGRQFFMKDSYSFDRSFEELDKSYEFHKEAYKKIYSRNGLKFFIVGASSGAMGGTGSQEFMVESPEGEDTCALCDNCGYAANLEVASSGIAPLGKLDGTKQHEEIYTPNIKTIDQLATFLKISTERLAKSLVYKVDNELVLILMSGNDQLNEAKLTAALGKNASAMEPEELAKYTGANAGSIGPIRLQGFKIIADRRLENANELISGANKDDYHITHIDLKRDVKIESYFDLRTIEAGEPCPKCNQKLRIVNAIEIGHIFKLGTKYSVALHANYLDEGGTEKPIVMGSYGIGVERIIACHIEQNHDENGIIWDKSIAPFMVHLISVNMDNNGVVSAAEKFFEEFSKSGIEVLYDDRQGVSPGFKFKDADLLGMPMQVIVGERNLKQGNIELKFRKTSERKIVSASEVVKEIGSYLNTNWNKKMTTEYVQAIGNLLATYKSDLTYIRNFHKHKNGEILKEEYLTKTTGTFKSFIDEFKVARNADKDKTESLLTLSLEWVRTDKRNKVDDFASHLKEKGITHEKIATSLASKILFLNDPWTILPLDDRAKRAVGYGHKENNYAEYLSKVENFRKENENEITQCLASFDEFLTIIEKEFEEEIGNIKTIRQNRFTDKLLWTIGQLK